ncbi:MAG: hypothetical protein WD800_00035, partial [Dehalococcoidia bacterium]
ADQCVRGALFVIDARGEPVEFAYSSASAGAGVLWRRADLRHRARTALLPNLFSAIRAVPALVLVRGADFPDGLGGHIEMSIPTAYLGASSDGGGTHSITWEGPLPTPESAGARLMTLLTKRSLLTEPFERASAGLASAVADG